MENFYKKKQDLYKIEKAAQYRKYKELSFKPNQDWPIITDFSKYYLDSLPKFSPGKPETVLRAGTIGHYRLDIDLIQSKNPIKFRSFDKIDQKRLSAQKIEKDPNIAKLITENGLKDTIIVASDAVLATIMTYSKSIYSWDIVVEKQGNMIYFERRDDEQLTSIDYENVGEN